MTSPYHKSLQGVGWISIVPGGTYPDPVHCAEIENLDYSQNEDTSDLTDANGDVVDVFVTKRGIEGTISLKDFSVSLLSVATRGVTVSAGRPLGYSYTVTIPTTPFEVTVPLTTPTRTFTTDMGVIDLTPGKGMTNDAASTGTNVYMLDTATGKYTFNTADAGHVVLINYRATPSTPTGVTGTVAQVANNTAVYYGLHCYQTQGAKPWGIYIPQALIHGLSAKFSKTGWSDSTLKWKAAKDSSGNFAYVYAAE